VSEVTELPRETGSDKSGSTCPTCGTDLPTVRTAYGSETAGPCPNCTGESLEEAEKALERENAERGYPLGDPSTDWLAGQLEAYAEANDVDLTGRKGSKADMVKAIEESQA
jgi:Zn-finger nucleic acid-binding protein